MLLWFVCGLFEFGCGYGIVLMVFIVLLVLIVFVLVLFVELIVNLLYGLKFEDVVVLL